MVSVRRERPWWAFFNSRITPSTIVTVEYDGANRQLKNSSWVAEGTTVTAYESGGELHANPGSIWTDTPMGHVYFAGMGISFVLLIVALTCTTYYRRGKHGKLTATSSGEGAAAKGEVTAGSSSASRPAAFVDLYDGIDSQTGEKVEPFTMDSYEWHH